MRTWRPGITVISFTTEDLIGFSGATGATGATLQDDPAEDEDEDEDETLRVLFLVGRATGEGDCLP